MLHRSGNELKECRAKTREDCRFYDSSDPSGGHFETHEEAEEYLERLVNRNHPKEEGLSKKIIPDEFSAKASRAYAYSCIMLNHLHNTRGNIELEASYYCTPQGRLELKRRLDNSKTRDNPEGSKDYRQMQELIDSPDFKPMEVDYSSVEALKEEGLNCWSHDFSDKDSWTKNKLYKSDRFDKKFRKPLRAAIVDHSYSWLKNLSSEQQEAVSELTSNGFEKLQATLDKNHEYWERESEPEKAFEEAQSFRKLCYSSFENAPKLEEPVITYRGTSIEEVRELVGENLSLEQFSSHLNKPEYKDVEINKTSRLSKIPVSCSTSPLEADRFGEDVILEIKRKTMTSPCNVSAWGTSEQEVLSNPISKYKIHGAFESVNSYEEPILVVQLEEID